MALKFDLKSLLKRKSAPKDMDQPQGESKGSAQLKDAAIWVKAHLLLVILGVVSAASIAGALLFSGEMLAGIESTAAEHKSKLDELQRLETSPVTITIPGSEPVNETTVVTRKLVDAVKARLGEGGSDSAQMRQQAVKHNKASHTPILNLRLDPKDPKLQEIHLDMVAQLKDRYDALVNKDLRGGAPLAEEDVMVKLQRSYVKFVQSDLKKAPTATLTPAEEAQLTSHLKQYRIGLYAESAAACKVYLVPEDVGMPGPKFNENSVKRKPARMWDLQQRFWVVEDILQACNSVNTSDSAATNPIKRIVRIGRPIAVAAVAMAAEGETIPMGGEGGGEDGGESGDAPPVDPNQPVDPNAAPAEGGAPPINPSQLVPVNQFSPSSVVKGWATNQLYDVFRTEVVMVAQTDAVPQIADAFAKQNFIAITDVQIVPTDAFEGLAEGFFYGDAPIVRVSFTLESAWLREWTGPLMPDDVRKKLGTSGQLAGITPEATSPPTQEN